MLHNVIEQLLINLKNTTWVEIVAVLFGIASVLLSRKENILLYPTGLINTILYTWFCFFWWGLFAEGSLNFYYTAMSIYGWFSWKKQSNKPALSISYNSKKDWQFAILFFATSWLILFYILKTYTKSTVPFADAFASASAYTAMWQMTRKKIESWWWWTLTNIASIPLYFIKDAPFTSFQYIIFLILSIAGLIEWKKKYAAATL
jgi:nicotinamide mononucleotide transporter